MFAPGILSSDTPKYLFDKNHDKGWVTKTSLVFAIHLGSTAYKLKNLVPRDKNCYVLIMSGPDFAVHP